MECISPPPKTNFILNIRPLPRRSPPSPVPGRFAVFVAIFTRDCRCIRLFIVCGFFLFWESLGYEQYAATLESGIVMGSATTEGRRSGWWSGGRTSTKRKSGARNRHNNIILLSIHTKSSTNKYTHTLGRAGAGAHMPTCAHIHTHTKTTYYYHNRCHGPERRVSGRWRGVGSRWHRSRRGVNVIVRLVGLCILWPGRTHAHRRLRPYTSARPPPSVAPSSRRRCLFHLFRPRG